MIRHYTKATLGAQTRVRAYVQSSGELKHRTTGEGIPVLMLGGPDGVGRDAEIEITFYGFSKPALLAELDRVAGAIEALRQAIVDEHDLDTDVVAAGRGSVVVATDSETVAA